jgi:histone-lysine N-methyltransferase SETMAR
VQFLWAEDMEAKDIHKEMPMCSEHCLSRQAVHNWVQKFLEGQTSNEDIIRADRTVTIDTVATTTSCSHGQAYNMMDERLGFHKVCSCWVPFQLTPQHKSQRMGLSLQHLQHYQDEGNDMLSRIITGDESWVHHYEPKTKHASTQWKHPASPAHRKLKVTSSAGKVMLKAFWDCQGVLLTEFQQRDHTVMSVSYCANLTKICAAIHQKRPGLLTKGMLLLHDNTCTHTANQTTATLRSFKWEVFQHPPYSPDLAPSDWPSKTTSFGGTLS